MLTEGLSIKNVFGYLSIVDYFNNDIFAYQYIPELEIELQSIQVVLHKSILHHCEIVLRCKQIGFSVKILREKKKNIFILFVTVSVPSHLFNSIC